jgi:hypothetical protein
MTKSDYFDTFWQWATEPVESYLLLDAEIHHAVTKLPEAEREDRVKVNEPVRKHLRHI